MVGALTKLQVLVLLDHFADKYQCAGERSEIFNVLKLVLPHLLITSNDVLDHFLKHRLFDQDVEYYLSAARLPGATQRFQ